MLNDAPTGESGNTDLMETTQVAQGLANLIIGSRAAAPFTLAIDAAWGMGKSSLMLRLADLLAPHPAVSVVWFNAWTSGQTSALEGLIKSVLMRFDRNVIRRAVRAMSGRPHLIGLLRATVLIAASVFGVRQTVDEIWRMLALDAKSRNEIRGVLRDAMRAWESGGRGPRNRLLVVFIDDLDRCADERIVEVCEAIKLYLDVPGIVFVLACDQAVLWRAVRGSAGVSEPTGAVQYLEKIVQLSYRIPPPSSSLALRLVDGYLEKSHTAGLFDDATKQVIIERSGRNPRRIKRLINSLVLEYHLNRAWQDMGVENLVRIVMLQHFYPTFYRILLDPQEDHDLIHNFLAYYELRWAVKQSSEEWHVERWRSLLMAKGIRPLGSEFTRDDLLDRLRLLEEELPVEFPALAADRDFVALLRSFDPSINSHQLQRLLRKPLTGADGYAQMMTQESDPIDGMRIVWIDDHQDTHRTVKDHLRRRGADLVLATDRMSALEAFRYGRPDVVLSDLTRNGNGDAGLDDLAYFREQRLYDGPVIFVSRWTPARERRANELGASGPVNDRDEIIRRISSIAADRWRAHWDRISG